MVKIMRMGHLREVGWKPIELVVISSSLSSSYNCLLVYMLVSQLQLAHKSNEYDQQVLLNFGLCSHSA